MGNLELFLCITKAFHRIICMWESSWIYEVQTCCSICKLYPLKGSVGRPPSLLLLEGIQTALQHQVLSEEQGHSSPHQTQIHLSLPGNESGGWLYRWVFRVGGWSWVYWWLVHCDEVPEGSGQGYPGSDCGDGARETKWWWSGRMV